jgi:hypothetical protein
MGAVLVAASDADPEAAGVHAGSKRNRLGGAEEFVAQVQASHAKAAERRHWQRVASTAHHHPLVDNERCLT